MALFPTRQILLELGPFTVTWYAFFSLTGALVCYLLSLRTMKRMGYSEEICENYFYWMLPTAYIGARIWYCLFNWSYYSQDPLAILRIWEGGLAYHGGVFAAVILGYFYTRHHGIHPLRMMDACFPNLLIGQAIGRWGNFVNQEAFGKVVSEEYFKFFPEFIKEGMYIHGAYRVPTFLYEGIGNLIGFILIRFVYARYGRKKRGDVAYAYLSWYGLVRLIVEGMRTDSLMLGPIRIAQLISIIFIVTGILGILGVYDKLFKNHWFFTKQKPVILFDVDETLLHTGPLIIESFKHVIRLHKGEDAEIDIKKIKEQLGPPLAQGLATLVPGEDVDQMIQEYRTFNMAHHDEIVTMFPGSKEMLEELKNRGYQLGVVSNKTEKIVRMGLDLFDLAQYFDAIICSEQMEKHKPDPDGLFKACQAMQRYHDNLVYVGDAPGDVKAARNISAFSVGVIFDEERAENMKKAQPCVMITSWDELITLLEEEREWSDNLMYYL